jgi:molybdopterin synthase catalytic subunit
MKIKVSITSRPIPQSWALDAVANPRSGGSVFFFGTVRSESRGMKVNRMTLEAAKDLAESDLRAICRRASKRFKVNDIAVMHRVGNLKVGDTIVVIGVGAPHRKDAFGACKFVIDELKKSTPIWKKEFGPKSERWV